MIFVMQEKRNYKVAFCNIMNYCNKGILLFYKPKCLLFIVLIISVLQKKNCQNIAVKSNVLYDLTSSLNIGGEIKCNDTYSISSIISYNPWTFADNRKMKHLLIQPELRKWFGDVFQGSFVGIQAHYARFNVGGILSDYRFQGNLVGGGVSYGYQWMISPLWNLEASIAFGYAYLSYDKYGRKEGASLIEKAHTNYVGPTQLGFSLVYFIQ